MLPFSGQSGTAADVAAAGRSDDDDADVDSDDAFLALVIGSFCQSLIGTHRGESVSLVLLPLSLSLSLCFQKLFARKMTLNRGNLNLTEIIG